MAEERVSRRLAAILAADVVGYSRLMEADEAGTRARMRSLHSELIDPRMAADGGRIVKTSGDGILVEFGSAVDAVNNALAIQSAIAGRNSELPEEQRLVFRVGINLGDVIIEGDDIHGDGVNVAARLEGLCEPGEVYVSGTVRDHVEGKLDATFEDLGEQTVKNIVKPIPVFRARRRTHSSTASSDRNQPLPITDKPSIAVLPFDNLSNDPEQEYFSDGLVEDLITDISKISGLFVVARNSSFAFKGQAVDVKEIAKKLGVKHVVEGSVRKMGAKLRINAQLIDATSGGHIWAERYDGDMENIFEFQDDIREQIVSALQVNLTQTDRVLTERKPTDSVEAYDLFLRGRANFYLYSAQNILEAIDCFEKAIEIDPNFAEAYSFISFCYMIGCMYMYPGFDDTFDRSHDFAERGVALDDTSAIALTRLAWIQTFLHRYDQAIANFEKAVALGPNNAETYAYFGQSLNYWGNPEKGLEMIEKALGIEKIPPPNWELIVGHSHLMLRQHDEAVRRFTRTIERAPKFTFSYLLLACAYVELDRLDDAGNAIKTALEITPRYTVREFARLYPYRLDEHRDRFLNGLRKAGLPE